MCRRSTTGSSNEGVPSLGQDERQADGSRAGCTRYKSRLLRLDSNTLPAPSVETLLYILPLYLSFYSLPLLAKANDNTAPRFDETHVKCSDD